MMTAGSPGVTCRSAKTARATTTITGMVATNRRRISASMTGTRSADRHVPEERRDELEDAGDVLAGRGRLRPLAPRHVGHLVERDLLDLLGERLAPGLIARAHEVGDELLEGRGSRPPAPRAPA